VRQAVPLAQPLNGAQVFLDSAGHAPLLQFAFAVSVLVAASHLAARHCVLFGHFEQAPLPSHLPSLPQLDCAVGAPHMASTTPIASGAHLPRLFESEQVWQAPVQALSQQTPSTQNFDMHSVPVVQVWPLPRRPQLPSTQALPATH
jgi:hypothetical protein